METHAASSPARCWPLRRLLAAPAGAQGFNWRSQDGQTVNLMFNNHPWSQAMREMVADFTAKTGIKTRMEIFNEEQFRARPHHR